jgi:PAB1-binding protein PBP1
MESRHIAEERGLIELAENEDEEAIYSAVLGKKNIYILFILR